MLIELLHTQGCQGYKRAIDALESALQELGIEARYTMQLVMTREEAEQARFFGSPTVRINGKDIDPKAGKMTHFGIATCRVYFWEGKAYDYPPKAMIKQALTSFI